MSLDEAVSVLRPVAAHATLLLDARDRDAGAVIAHVSRDGWMREHCFVQLYPYGYADAADLIADVQAYDPAPDWREAVGIMPGLYGDNLRLLSGLAARDKTNVPALAAAGRRWLDTFREEGLNVKAHGLNSVFASRYMDLPTDTITTPYGRAETPDQRRPFYEDYAVELLIREARGKKIPVLFCLRRWDFIENGIPYFIQHRIDRPQPWDERDPATALYLARGDPKIVLQADIVTTENFHWVAEFLAHRAEGLDYVPGDGYDTVLRVNSRSRGDENRRFRYRDI